MTVGHSNISLQYASQKFVSPSQEQLKWWLSMPACSVTRERERDGEKERGRVPVSVTWHAHEMSYQIFRSVASSDGEEEAREAVLKLITGSPWDIKRDWRSCKSNFFPVKMTRIIWEILLQHLSHLVVSMAVKKKPQSSFDCRRLRKLHDFHSLALEAQSVMDNQKGRLVLPSSNRSVPGHCSTHRVQTSNHHHHHLLLPFLQQKDLPEATREIERGRREWTQTKKRWDLTSHPWQAQHTDIIWSKKWSVDGGSREDAEWCGCYWKY